MRGHARRHGVQRRSPAASAATACAGRSAAAMRASIRARRATTATRSTATAVPRRAHRPRSAATASRIRCVAWSRPTVRSRSIALEQCDDGNFADHDGCNTHCELENAAVDAGRAVGTRGDARARDGVRRDSRGGRAVRRVTTGNVAMGRASVAFDEPADGAQRAVRRCDGVRCRYPRASCCSAAPPTAASRTTPGSGTAPRGPSAHGRASDGPLRRLGRLRRRTQARS